MTKVKQVRGVGFRTENHRDISNSRNEGYGSRKSDPKEKLADLHAMTDKLRRS